MRPSPFLAAALCWVMLGAACDSDAGRSARDAVSSPDVGPAAPDARDTFVAEDIAAEVAAPAETSAGDTQPDAAPAIPDYGFAEHLREAVAIQRERREIYAGMTAEASRPLFDLLVASEESLIPVAENFDRRALPFHEEGIPVVAADFVSMEHIATTATPPTRGGELTTAAEEAVATALEPLQGVDIGDFQAVADASYDALAALAAIEETHDVHLAMSKHLIESAAYAALHGLAYDARSEGRTHALCTDLVVFQLELPLGLNLGLTVDRQANAFHRQGIGIIVNDVPHIPFVEEYEQFVE